MRTHLQPSLPAQASIWSISGSQRFMSLTPQTVMTQTLPISELIRTVAAADSTVRRFHAIHSRLRPARMSASISARALSLEAFPRTFLSEQLVPRVRSKNR